jgi:hypothetical protein
MVFATKALRHKEKLLRNFKRMIFLPRRREGVLFFVSQFVRKEKAGRKIAEAI